MVVPCYFEIHADDCDRAQKFYGGLFGWSFTPFPAAIEYYRITTEANAMQGGLLKRPGQVAPFQHPSSFVVTLLVDSVDDTMQKALAAGAITAMDKFAVPGVGWSAYLIDTEKNIFGIFRPDPDAK